MARWVRHRACELLSSTTRGSNNPDCREKKLTMQQQRRGGLAVLGEGVQIAVGSSSSRCSSLRVVVTQPTAASESRNFSSSPSRYGGLARSPEPAPGTGEGGKGGRSRHPKSKLTFFFARHPVTGRRIGKLGDGRGHQKVPKNRGRTRENLHFDGLW